LGELEAKDHPTLGDPDEAAPAHIAEPKSASKSANAKAFGSLFQKDPSEGDVEHTDPKTRAMNQQSMDPFSKGKTKPAAAQDPYASSPAVQHMNKAIAEDKAAAKKKRLAGQFANLFKKTTPVGSSSFGSIPAAKAPAIKTPIKTTPIATTPPTPITHGGMPSGKTMEADMAGRAALNTVPPAHRAQSTALSTTASPRT
jgi:hypothetical protein